MRVAEGSGRGRAEEPPLGRSAIVWQGVREGKEDGRAPRAWGRRQQGFPVAVAKGVYGGFLGRGRSVLAGVTRRRARDPLV